MHQQQNLCEISYYNCGIFLDFFSFIVKKAYELLNLTALKISTLYRNCIFQCMAMYERGIFFVEFQRYPLKFHTKYLTHISKYVYFFRRWRAGKCFKRPLEAEVFVVIRPEAHDFHTIRDHDQIVEGNCLQIALKFAIHGSHHGC